LVFLNSTSEFNEGGEMIGNKWKARARSVVAAVLMLSSSAIVLGICGEAVSAQEKTQQAIAAKAAPNAYQMAREMVLTGKVLEYSATSTSAPVGARISLQTSSGTISVHAGNAKYIAANHLSLEAGDTVSITGENVSFGTGTIFVARVIQKGTQTLAVRSKTGMPLLPTSRTADGQIVAPAGAR
jgi:hypothetical protein